MTTPELISSARHNSSLAFQALDRVWTGEDIEGFLIHEALRQLYAATCAMQELQLRMIGFRPPKTGD